MLEQIFIRIESRQALVALGSLDYLICVIISLVILRRFIMYKEIDSYSIDNDNEIYTVKFDAPSHCPHCKKGLDPILIDSTFSVDSVGKPNKVCNTYYCTMCRNFFLAIFTVETALTYSLLCSDSFLIPDGFKKHKFSNSIETVSSRFSEIFNQAAQAESLGFYEICGMGYRKALEILVKDYSISLKQSEKDKILNMPLVQCIKDYIEDDDLKNIATASAWLGNDETHYTKKLEGVGLKELKSFLESMISFIEFKCRAKNAKVILDNKNS